MVSRRGLSRRRHSCLFINGLDRIDWTNVYHRCDPPSSHLSTPNRRKKTIIQKRTLLAQFESDKAPNRTPLRQASERQLDRRTALPGTTFYAATKAEVAILTKRFAMELGSRNITVNAVAPGFVRTDMTRGDRGANDWQGTEERFAARAMIGRIGEPEDIANAVAFLASPESG